MATTWVTTGSSPAGAEVSTVGGGACGYYVNVGLFGGPQSLRGCGQSAGAPASAASPSVTLPPGGSAGEITAHDADGALAQYGPAAIFSGIWPDHVNNAPPSGPITTTTAGSTGSGGSVTSSVDIVLHNPPSLNAPGGIGPGPLVADEAHSTCTTTESGVSASATFVNGILETKYDSSTQEPIVTEPIPVNPPPNYTRSGTIDHVGDRYTIVFNEQIVGPDSITVNAAHMYLLGEIARGEMVVGQSTCSLSSTVPNSAPAAVADSYATTTSDPLTVAAPGLLANDTDPDGNVLSATSAQAVFVPGPDHPEQSTGNTYVFPSDPVHGTVSMDPDGSFTYTPDGDFTGTDSFQYVVRDARGANSTGTVSIDVSGNRTPTAVDDRYTKVHGVPLHIPAPGVLGNDTDAEGDPITAGGASDPPGGTVLLEADGSFTYIPDLGFSGTDQFTYLATDVHGGSNPALVTITQKVVNSPPTAVDDAYDAAEDVPLVVAAPGVLANDTDFDGDTLLAASASEPANGSVTLGSNGRFTYTPDAEFSGTDTFTYTVSDGGSSDTGQVTVTLAAVNDVPVAGDDAYTTDEDTPLTVAAPGVLGNDTDVEDDALVAGSASDPANGSVTLAADGSFTYTPDADFSGDDSFTYPVSDGNGGTDTGVVTITVVDVLPLVSVGDVAVAEGDAGTRGAVFTVSLSEPSASTVTVAYATTDGTGTAPGDYTARSGTLSFTPGMTSTKIKVPLVGDTADEGSGETFAVSLSDADGAVLGDGAGAGTIVDDDPKAVTGRTLAVGDVSLHEGDAGGRTALFTVSLSKASTSSVSVSFATANATATKVLDYTRTLGTLTFAPGVTSMTVKVPIAPDNLAEGDETFTVNLSGSSGATIVDATGVGTIVDDE